VSAPLNGFHAHAAAGLLGLLVVLPGCGPSEAELAAERAAVEARAREAAAAVQALADEYVAGYFDQFPEQALVWGAPDPDPGRLSDNSLASLARWQILQQDLLAQLDAVDTEALTDPAARITADFLRHRLESDRGLAVCRMELWNVSPTWTGWLAEFTVLAGKLRMDTPRQQAQALSRVAQMAGYVDTEIANLQEGVELGYTAPRNSVRAVLAQLDAFLALPLGATPFLRAAREQDIGFRERLRQVVESELLPPLQRYRDYLASEYATAARAAIGVDANPDGAACYRAAVRYWTTVDLDPKEIHRIGLEQMERILAEMSTIGARSFGASDPVALMRKVKSEPQYLFGSREEMVAYAEAALERARQALPGWFGRVPAAPVIVEPYPEFQEQSAPLGQAVPAAQDGSSPGKYLINTYRAEQQSRAGLEATAFHEAYPGHHTQFTIAQERTDLHPISRYFFLSGFGEGWALYTERLADEMGLYSSDLDRLGMLSNEAWRAARLVVDSGIHGLGWSREQALDYLDKHTANARELNAAEIDRYIAVPGQATSYLLGALEIRRLRQQAEAALGDRFDIRAFHDRVLEDGAMPLARLGAKVERWIEANTP
jgi:uncharacterized protein (DUF885 family)